MIVVPGLLAAVLRIFHLDSNRHPIDVAKQREGI